MAIAPVLKTGARKGLGVRVPHPPFHSPGLRLQWAKKVLPLVSTLALVAVRVPAQPTNAVEAVRIVDSLMATNPQDVKTLNMAWRVYLAASQFEKALSVGEKMIRADTAMADTAFFIRSAAAAEALGSERGAEIIARGLAKYPHNATLLIMHATVLRRIGQNEAALAAANHAMTVDPRLPESYFQKALILNGMKEPDSVIATIRSGASKASNSVPLANVALMIGSDAYRVGHGTGSRKDLQHAVELLLMSDEIRSSTDARFLAGASAFQTGLIATNEAETRKDCSIARLAQKAFTTARENLPAGLRSYPDEASRLLKQLPPMIRQTDGQVDRLCVNARARN